MIKVFQTQVTFQNICPFILSLAKPRASFQTQTIITLRMQPSHSYRQIIPEYKIVVLGEGGVGKSSLTVRLCSDNFIDEYDPTVEDCYRKKAVIDGHEVLLEITDTAGQEEFQGMRDEWIREGDGYLLVYSISLSHSFEELCTIRERILQTNDCASAPVVVAGNKCDLEDERAVQITELQKLGNEWNCPIYETSAKTKVNNKECFYQCVREIVRYQNAEKNGGDLNDNKMKQNICQECLPSKCCVLL
eukprot:342613_1